MTLLGIAAKGSYIYFVETTEKGGKRGAALIKKTAAGALSSSPFSLTHNKKSVNLEHCSDFRICEAGSTGFYMFFRLKSKTGSVTCQAHSKDLAMWTVVAELPIHYGTAVLAPGLYSATLAKMPAKRLMFTGGNTIRVGFSKTFKDWTVLPEPVLRSRHHYFDSGALDVAAAFKEPQGVLLFYYNRTDLDHAYRWSVGAALIDAKDPSKVLWRLDYPLFEAPDEWAGRATHPLGIVKEGKRLVMYWTDRKGELISVSNPEWDNLIANYSKDHQPHLNRFAHNPIIHPDTKSAWQSKAAFNPAAVYMDGKVHLLYRAIGEGDMSVLGYASSRDGVHFHERLPEPAYVPREGFEGIKAPEAGPDQLSLALSAFVSGGGGYGGVEDPRITQIGDKLYLLYVAYNGWSEPRVAMSTINEGDFLAKRWWKWSKPVLISRPGEINKNAAILPEKIRGKYVIFHRVYPDVLIDYVDSLEDFDGETKWLKTEAKIKPRKAFWDSRKLGIGAPPIKTKYGWLIIYQGLGEQESWRYKVGAMLLDLENPERVIARTRAPILEPDASYENHGWKSGVVYPCGAVVIDDTLFVYYGGADTNVSVATANLDDFLKKMISQKDPEIKRIPLITINADSPKI